MRSLHRNILFLVLSAAFAGNAWAVDQPCLDEDGNPLPAEPTDQGIEYGIDNTTCMFNAFAFGRGNIASATGMSAAFGSSNRIYGTAGYAFGFQNTATNRALALGEANTATGQGSIAIGAISSTSMATLSPGITISTPCGSCTTPVTSVVRK